MKQMRTTPLFDLPLPVPPFGGKTFDEKLDRKRLTGQWRRVFDLMSDGKWRTLGEIQAANLLAHGKHDSEAAISARLRDFRKEAFGGHTVNLRRRGDGSKGLFEYQVVMMNG